MLCSGCGAEVSERQKFCHECAAPVTQGADTPDLDAPLDGVHEATSSRGLLPTQPVAVVRDLAPPPPIDTVDEHGDDSATTIDQHDDDSEHGDDLAPTELIAATEGSGGPGDDHRLEPTEPITTLPEPSNTPTEIVEVVEVEPSGFSDTWIDAAPTTPVATTDAWESSERSTAPVTAEMPAIFDGDPDLADYSSASEPFKIRLVFVIALFGAAAVLMSMVATVIDLRTTRPEPGIVSGARTLEQLGTNLGLAGFVGAAVMVLGALLACFGLRWGAGLAGGAGLALSGWAALSIGLAEFPIAVAESITRTSPELFTLRVTRDLGWWLIVGVGVVGLIVFVLSLRSVGSGGRAALNPLIAALTAVAAVILAFGPLVPESGASFTDNFRSTDPTRDLPTAFFAGRLTQVALIALAGVIGMLLVRSWGVGLAVGSLSVPVWLWISSLGEIGSDPIGIAVRNPGADTTVPNAVTTVGMVATLVLLAIASILATYRLTRSRPAA